LNSFNVPDEHLASIRALLNRYPEQLATGLALPVANNATMEINLTDNFIVTRRPYRLSDSERGEVRPRSPVLSCSFVRNREHIECVLIFAS
jgi:hypothetical protein